MDCEIADQIFVGGVGVSIDAGFTWRTFAVPVAAVFQRKDVGREASEEFVGGNTVSDVCGISVKGEERPPRVVVGNPPSM